MKYDKKKVLAVVGAVSAFLVAVVPLIAKLIQDIL